MAGRFVVSIHLIRINGPRWATYVGAYLGLQRLGFDSRRLAKRIKALEHAKSLPGVHSEMTQKLIWNSWDWATNRGEQWAPTADYQSSVVDHILRPRASGTVLEIGPGDGRWSLPLANLADQLILVDISHHSLEQCQRRLGEYGHIVYLPTEGTNLDVPAESVDFVWSWDVFVHLNQSTIRRYLHEIRRVLVPGGSAVIHHSGSDGSRGGWRSSMTASRFSELADESGLTVTEQFDSWGEYDLRDHGDVITVLVSKYLDERLHSPG